MIKIERKIWKDPKTWIVLFMAIVITILGVKFHQKWYRIMPLYISLIVMMLQTKANKYNFLLGGLNSILYFIVDMSLHIYGAALQAILLSFPIQILTFIRWNKRSYKGSTVLKKLSLIHAIILGVILVASWIVSYYFLGKAGTKYLTLDTTSFVVGFLQMYLSLFSYIEYTYVGFVSAIIGLVIQILYSMENPAQLTYVVYSTYSWICITASIFFTRGMYKEQQRLLKEKFDNEE